MKLQQQVPRNALVWIIISMFALVAPHALRLPPWVLLVYVVAVVWRILVYRGRWSFPGRSVKLILIFSSFIGVYVSYGTLVGLEPMVALLLTAFAFKLIELSRRNDAYVLLFLGYFVCITEFLFSQDLLITLYSMLNVVLVTTALVALHQPGEHQFNRGSIRLAGVMLAQALPLMVVIFFLFPRIDPLWTVPVNNHMAKTGMSDFMKPGDVAKLSQSADVALRVKFDGDIPPVSALYWRGLVFSRMQQGAWSALDYYDVPVKQQRPREMRTSGDALEYTVIMEPSWQNWLYGLHYARATTAGVRHTADYRLSTLSPLETEYMYRVRSWTQAQAEPGLSQWRREIETRLPPGSNPRTRQLAQEMKASTETDQQFIDAVLNKFSTQDYVYTLQPGSLSELHAMDEFLFESRRGFCEHYASAFTVMMRAAGVPARVVAGYLGGEINPVNRTVIVHQFDAHAWAEVWLQGQGWVRVDPTAAVSPERIEWGLEAAMQAEGSFLSEAPLSALRYRNIPFLNLLRLRYDALTYRWQSWIVGFNSERQFNLLRDIFGNINTQVIATVLLGSWVLVLVPVSISLFRKRATRQVSRPDKFYLKFCERLARLGLVRSAGETPGQFFLRAEAALPAYAGQMRDITSLYNQLAYAGTADGEGADAGTLDTFSRAVKRFRPSR
ncbi:MAG: DUF3488 and transglutaminase-like domain-containing protein [Gammaproteobacteria bacterium]|nr:DUF3488 and transglutaminase-like domain-containing protein [Gammaproteobacteria bacterium]